MHCRSEAETTPHPSGDLHSKAPLLKPVQRQSVSAADAGLLKDVLQMDLDGAGLNAERIPDFLILQTALHQVNHLELARRQRAPSAPDRYLHVRQQTVL